MVQILCLFLRFFVMARVESGQVDLELVGVGNLQLTEWLMVQI